MSERPRRTSNISYIEPNSSTDDSDVDHDGGNSSSTKKNRSKAPCEQFLLSLSIISYSSWFFLCFSPSSAMKKARFADDSFGIKSSEKRKGKGKGKAVTKRKGKAQILLTMPLDIFSVRLSSFFFPFRTLSSRLSKKEVKTRHGPSHKTYPSFLTLLRFG